MTRSSLVTLSLREEDARWLLAVINDSRRMLIHEMPQARRVIGEIKHALTECPCAGDESIRGRRQDP